MIVVQKAAAGAFGTTFITTCLYVTLIDGRFKQG